MATWDDEDAEVRKENKREIEARKRTEALRTIAVRALFATIEGRIYLRWLLEKGKALGQQPFRSEANATSFHCGEMNVGLQIMADLMSIDPEGFALLFKETASEYYDRRNRNATDQPDLFTDEGEHSDGGPEADSALYN